MPAETPSPGKARKTGIFQRLKELVVGGESELEAERNSAYKAAKEALQRRLKEGKITAAEVAKQLKLIRNGAADPEPHA